MDSEYILNLFNQFHKAVGMNIKDWTSQQFIFQFSDWLKEYKKVVNEYSMYNQFLGIDLANPFLAEVGKGKYDSIVSKDIMIISPYASTLKKEQSSLILLDSTPLVATAKGIVNPKHIEMFLTHNPYDSQNISEWYKIHNTGSHNISVGVYGKLYDKDKEDKLEIIKRLSEQMEEDYETSYDTSGNNYFCNITSHRKQKVKILTR